MKKHIILILALTICSTTFLTSCKKDNQESRKELVIRLLTSHKWYYESALHNGKEDKNCYDNDDNTVFNTNGSYVDSIDEGQYTYSVSEDGSRISFHINNETFTYIITKITDSELHYSDSTYSFRQKKSENGACD